MGRIKTDVLDIAYYEDGPSTGPVVLLLHGWPDCVRAWHKLAPLLAKEGFRTIAPDLRGFGQTHFRSSETVRDGRGVAIVQDAIDLADALGIERFSVVGHDWGGRAAYFLSALFPERVSRMTALAIPYNPHGVFQVPAFAQARRIWYQWLMCVDGGAEAIRKDPKGFARIQWETWSPIGWFEDAEFKESARSFENPDWLDITLHAYRSRYLPEKGDPRYDQLEERLALIDEIIVPALVIQGGADNCDPPERYNGQEQYFRSDYRRVLLSDVGHFPAREAPARVATEIVAHLNV